MHEVLLQAAQFGGECVLALLFVSSIVGIAVISERLWFYYRTRVDADAFARSLLQALHNGDLSRARSLASRSQASLCLVISAGLSQLPQGLRSMRAAMRIAKVHERTRLEGQASILGALGQSTLLLGLLGTVFDLMQVAILGSAEGLNASAPVATPPDVLAILTPLAGGLLVAIPALFADRMFKNHVRQTLRRIDSVSQLVTLQLRELQKKHAAPSTVKSQAA